jgi:shikimate 5-dehydrogenase
MFHCAQEFGEGFVASTPDECAATLAKLGRLDYVVCTLPGSTGYVLPDDVLAVVARHKPIVVEASYIPRHTAFVKQVRWSDVSIVGMPNMTLVYLLR